MSQLEEIQGCILSWVTQDKHSPLRLWSPLTKGCTSAWLELPFSSRTVFRQPAHHCNGFSVFTLLPVSAWTWPKGALPAAPCSAGIARGCLSFCCCKSHLKHFTASVPRLSEMRMFPVSGICMTTRNVSILSMSHEYSHSVHRSSEKHICTASCRVKRMYTPA